MSCHLSSTKLVSINTSLSSIIKPLFNGEHLLDWKTFASNTNFKTIWFYKFLTGILLRLLVHFSTPSSRNLCFKHKFQNILISIQHTFCSTHQNHNFIHLKIKTFRPSTNDFNIQEFNNLSNFDPFLLFSPFFPSVSVLFRCLRFILTLKIQQSVKLWSISSVFPILSSVSVSF